MRRVLAVTLGLVLMCSATLTGRALAQTSGKTNPPATRKNSAETEIKQARLDGWNEGFDAGARAGQLLYSTPLEASGQKLKISLVVEDIDGADSFRLAAAEVIRTHFSDNLEIDPTGDATTFLWINGTKVDEVRPGVNFQGIGVAVAMNVSHWVSVKGKARPILGRFVLADAAGTYWAYTNERKAQVVREQTYKVVSEFLQKWQQAEKPAKP